MSNQNRTIDKPTQEATEAKTDASHPFIIKDNDIILVFEDETKSSKPGHLGKYTGKNQSKNKNYVRKGTCKLE